MRLDRFPNCAGEEHAYKVKSNGMGECTDGIQNFYKRL
jgi:hypothetical protein